MTNQKEIQLLRSASNEIKSLRSQNQLMKARLDMFDSCMGLLTANLQISQQGMSPDLVWEIDRFVDSENEKQLNNPM